jgi:hypothetical protein
LDPLPVVFPDSLFGLHAPTAGDSHLYCGRALHGSEPVVSGEKINLVVRFRLVWQHGSPDLAEFLSLPDELLLAVLSLLDQRDLCIAGAVCSRLHGLATSNELWHHLAFDAWQAAVGEPPRREWDPPSKPPAEIESGSVKAAYLSERAARRVLLHNEQASVRSRVTHVPTPDEAARRWAQLACERAQDRIADRIVCVRLPVRYATPLEALPDLFPRCGDTSHATVTDLAYRCLGGRVGTGLLQSQIVERKKELRRAQWMKSPNSDE